MEITIVAICSILIGYLLGSISNGVIIGKKFFGVDVREKGSHNAGGTNTGRVLGKKAGIITILLDMAKTIIAMLSVYYLLTIPAIASFAKIDHTYYAYMAAVGAFIGHTFPLYFNFRGGKVVACFSGLVICTSWLMTIVGVITFFTVLLPSKYVSLSSIITSITCTILAYLIVFVFNFGTNFGFTMDIYYPILMTCASIFLIIRHHANIGRLIHHNESKVYLFKKKESK